MVGAAVSAGLVLSALPLAPALAAGGGSGWGDTGGDGDGWSAQAGTVTITVSGSGGHSVGRRSVPGPTPFCRYVPTAKAEDLQREWGHADEDFSYEDVGLNPETGLPWDIQEHMGQPGMYWSPMCGGAEWPGSDEARDAYEREFFANNNMRWVGPADPLPPPPPVPAAVLLEMAKEYLDPPEPEVSVNPEAMSMVNLETWVWAAPATFGDLQVRAESGPNWAQIDAHATGLSLTTSAAAQARQVGTCATGGAPYDRSKPASAQSTDCAIVFGRSTAIAPAGWPLQVTSSWAARGTTSDGDAEDLVPVAASATVQLDVAELQATVDRVGT
jgi:hypothetical protein